MIDMAFLEVLKRTRFLFDTKIRDDAEANSVVYNILLTNRPPLSYKEQRKYMQVAKYRWRVMKSNSGRLSA